MPSSPSTVVVVLACDGNVADGPTLVARAVAWAGDTRSDVVLVCPESSASLLDAVSEASVISVPDHATADLIFQRRAAVAGIKGDVLRFVTMAELMSPGRELSSNWSEQLRLSRVQRPGE